MSKNKVEKFDQTAANKLSDRLKKKVLEIQESIEVIDELSDAKALYMELNSTNEALQKQIGLNKDELEKEQIRLEAIKETVRTAQLQADKEISRAKEDAAEAIKAISAETKNKISGANTRAGIAESESVDRIRIAGKKADEAAGLAEDAERHADEATAKYNELKTTMFK